MWNWSWEKRSTSLHTAKIIDKNSYSRLGSANWQPNNDDDDDDDDNNNNNNNNNIFNCKWAIARWQWL
jgi:hypothetical protein